jgi:Ca2+-binding RTX toxin-like protein
VQSSVTFSLLAATYNNVENLTLTGTTAINATGNSLNNTLTGNSAANTLNGGIGNDTMIGGGGADTLTGGTGADTFDYNATSETGVGVGLRDIITDFVSGQDKIDLSGIDANGSTAGDPVFSFIGTAAFSATAQVRAVFDGTNTIVQGNIGGGNGNTVDFEILLSGNVPFVATDLIP